MTTSDPKEDSEQQSAGSGQPEREPQSRFAKKLLEQREQRLSEVSESDQQSSDKGSAGGEEGSAVGSAKVSDQDETDAQPAPAPPMETFSSEELPADSGSEQEAPDQEKKKSKSEPRLEKVTGRKLVRLLDEEDLDAEIEAAMGEFKVQSLLKGSFSGPSTSKQSSAVGGPDKRTVRVLSVRGSDIFVDLGEKSEGVVSILQYEEDLPKENDLVELIVDHYDSTDDLYVMRRPGVVQEADWGSVEKGMIVDAHVKKVNKGGLEVSVNGLRGFMPAGQVDLLHIENLAVFIGQTLRSLVTEVSLSAKNLVVSRKEFQLKEREEQARTTLESLAEGKIFEGVVRRISDFGAFIDIGGVDGLLHISQMSWQRLEHPKELLSVGQTVKVVVLSYDPEARKIGLGLRQLSPSPWEKAEATYRPGAIISGKVVTRLADFGAFVELEPAIEGLIHISELAHERISRVSKVVQVGQEVDVKVLDFDRERERISLSLKAALPEPELPEEEEVADELTESKLKGPTKPLKGGLGDGPVEPLFEL